MAESKITKFQAANGTEISLSVDIVRKSLCGSAKNATDAEIMQFIELCRYQGINPFLKEAYLVKYGGVDAECSIITSKELFLKRAEQNPNFDGAESGCIVLRNGSIEYIDGTFNLPTDEVVGGWAKVYRKDQAKPTYISVAVSEYQQHTKTGQITKFWREKPATMIRKVALMQAMREAFCTSLGALYTEEEQNITIETTAEIVDERKTIDPRNELPQQPAADLEKVKELPQSLTQLEMGRQKVTKYITDGNLAGAENGLLWLKSTYPNEKFDALERVLEGAKANIKIEDI